MRLVYFVLSHLFARTAFFKIIFCICFFQMTLTMIKSAFGPFLISIYFKFCFSGVVII